MKGGFVGRCAGAALLLLTAPACPSVTFQCADDEQCPQGSCIDGACAFADEACTSGMRFAPYSPGGLGGTCVPEADGTSTLDPGSGDAPMSPSSSTSSPPASSSDAVEPSSTAVSGTGIETSSTTEGVGMSSVAGSEESSSSGPPVDPDLVAWFPCEGEGPSIGLDASGNGHDGTCDSCPESGLGISGQACAFDGTQVITVPFDSAFALEEFTIAAWLLPDALPDDRLLSAAGIPLGGGQANAYQFGFNGLGDADLVFFCSGSLGTQACINEPLTLEGWVHVAVTSSAAGIQIYFDGALAREAAANPFVHEMGDFLMGQDLDDGVAAHEFAGSIDELRLYSRALSELEVEALATP